MIRTVSLLTLALCLTLTGCVTSSYVSGTKGTDGFTKVRHVAFAPPGSKNIADQMTRATIEADGAYTVEAGSVTDMQNTFDETLTNFLGMTIMEMLATGNVPQFLRPPTSEPVEDVTGFELE